jgi:hypothetical protein
VLKHALRCWIDNGRGNQMPWEFKLLLGDKAMVREEIDWTRFLPDDDVTGWLSMDLGTRFMKICPLAAYPGREAATM